MTGTLARIFISVTQRRIYQDAYPYFVTFVTAGRARVFDDAQLAERLGRIIMTCCILKGYRPMAFCILPDHVHLLVERVPRGTRTLEKVRCESMYTFQSMLSRVRRSRQHHRTASISRLVQSIKGTYSRAMPSGRFWQPRFYARIVDSDRYLNNVITYVVHNHRKHGLPGRYGQQPHVFIREA